jgi:hypothetical protein
VSGPEVEVDRILTTLLFTDFVSSTEPSRRKVTADGVSC